MPSESEDSAVKYAPAEPASDDQSNSSNDESTRQQLPESHSSIIYKIEWGDDKNYTRQNFESTVPFGPLEVVTENVDHRRSTKTSLKGKVPLEIVTPVWGRAVSDVRDNSPDRDSGTRSKKRALKRRIAFQDIKIRKVGKTKMIIRSRRLLGVIRRCVTYYPEKPLTGKEVEFKEPYPVLIHHFNRLGEAQGKLDPEDDVWKYLQSMLEYLKEYMEPSIKPAIEKLQSAVPSVTFDELWLLFKPGSDVYMTVSGAAVEHFSSIVVGGVVMSTTMDVPSKTEKEGGQKRNFKIHLWRLESDGKHLSREWSMRRIPEYEGERQVTSLPLHPCEYRDIEDGWETRRAVIDRGRQAYQMLRAMPKQMWYDGYPYALQRQMYRGNCILDTNEYLSTADVSEGQRNFYHFLKNEITPQSEHTDMLEPTLSEFIFSSFHHISLAETTSLPTDRHYLLLQAFIPGFALYDKTWKIFSVESLTELQPTMGMDNLIIDPVNREIVHALTYAQSYPFKFDQAHNKGEGRVVLLHGSPGVGKTYTVECIAQATDRPLLSLTPGDLMGEEDEVDEILRKWFALSEHWKAILLLDEADIFLERRATRDIQRNGIVSIFLRRMEYFRGLLFLTTNRVGSIDDAFLSRVSAVLQYDHLSDDTRKKIWQGFFKKLQKDAEVPGGQKIEVDKYAQKYIFNDEEVRDLRWNGREIRNALQTAISLATYKALRESKGSEEVVDVEEEHFRSVVSMSRKFRTYMKDISGLEEDERARSRMERVNPGKAARRVFE